MLHRQHLLSEALKRNQKLWTLFQAELARPDHELPVDLRRDLLRISRFIDKRTFELLSSPEPEKLTALIDINRRSGAVQVQLPVDVRVRRR